ncbi:hypothetical protein [Sneathiella glossodoripedis]|uniref:hypothetical protein n=1 Tax=Sneathiella glossodoripedis TaxID=418853 RepID=UPI00046E9A2A|nr:hypothetical protein [Sneathiella glossodoripedis]
MISKSEEAAPTKMGKLIVPDVSVLKADQLANMQQMIKATQSAAGTMDAVIAAQRKLFESLQQQLVSPLAADPATAASADNFSENLTKLSENMQKAIGQFSKSSEATVEGTTDAVVEMNKAFEQSLKKVEQTAIKFSGG